MAEGNGEQVGWLEDLVSAVRRWHDGIIEASGGAAGEHTARLIACCARPFQTAFGEDLFQTDVEKAAALFHGIITSHAFVDGNKRTATVVAVLLLIGREYLATSPTSLHIAMLGEVALATARGELKVDEVAGWFHRILDD